LTVVIWFFTTRSYYLLGTDRFAKLLPSPADHSMMALSILQSQFAALNANRKYISITLPFVAFRSSPLSLGIGDTTTGLEGIFGTNGSVFAFKHYSF
jgi:hypothetical protein